MIQERTVHEIRCDGCGKRWGEENEPDLIVWEETPDGIANRFEQVEGEKTMDVGRWEVHKSRLVAGAPAVIARFYCPECKEPPFYCAEADGYRAGERCDSQCSECQKKFEDEP